MKTIREIFWALIVGLMFIVLVGQYCALSTRTSPTVVYVQDPNYVQNIGEAQRRLKEQGLYHGKIDYLWGKETDHAYCDYCAIRTIEGR